MVFAAALALIVQSAAPVASPGAFEAAARPTRTIATPATARARILRPAIITIDQRTAQPELGTPTGYNVQRERDEAGTVWIEFS